MVCVGASLRCDEVRATCGPVRGGDLTPGKGKKGKGGGSGVVSTPLENGPPACVTAIALTAACAILVAPGVNKDRRRCSQVAERKSNSNWHRRVGLSASALASTIFSPSCFPVWLCNERLTARRQAFTACPRYDDPSAERFGRTGATVRLVGLLEWLARWPLHRVTNY